MIPTAVAQQFAANEYVAACYYIMCCTPNNNSKSNLMFYDNNSNGTYDEGIDEIFFKGGWAYGCDGIHLARIEGEIANNGIAVRDYEENPYTKPVFLWKGYVKDASNPHNEVVSYDTHVTDLSREGAWSLDTETNFS